MGARGGALRHGRFPTQAPVLKEEADARGGARRHGRFPTQARWDNNVVGEWCCWSSDLL